MVNYLQDSFIEALNDERIISNTDVDIIIYISENVTSSIPIADDYNTTDYNITDDTDDTY